MINKNKEIRIHWDKIVFVIVMIGMTMFLSYSFYITHILDADSYGGIWNYYQNKNLGISSSNGISFKLYDILNLLMYSLFGIDEKLILGVRLGTPAVTSRGMKEDDMDLIAEAIATPGSFQFHCLLPENTAWHNFRKSGLIQIRQD